VQWDGGGYDMGDDSLNPLLPLCGPPRGVMFSPLFFCVILKCFATGNFYLYDGDCQKVFVNRQVLASLYLPTLNTT
jgi:hypothetical protein